jgi:hypothetical protein
VNQNKLQLLQSLSPGELISDLETLVSEERDRTTAILHYFNEIERRGAHLERGFASLHEFAVHLGYSDGAAHRRISAARLLRELPQVEPAIQSGELNLSTASQIQTFLKTEKTKRKKSYSPEEKSQLVEALKNKSTREVEKELLKISPESIPQERERRLTEDKVEVRTVYSDGTLAKLQEIKELLSNKNPNMSHAELIDFLADMGLKELRKKKPEFQPQHVPSKQLESVPTPAQKFSRFVPSAVKRELWRTHKGCDFVDPETGNRCGARYRLEIDHVIPLGVGGATTLSNLRLLCRAHNVFMARRHYGSENIRRIVQSRRDRLAWRR